MTEETKKLIADGIKKADISLRNDLYFRLGEDGNFSARYKPEPERAQVSFNRMMEYVAQKQEGQTKEQKANNPIFLHHSGDKKLALDENTTTLQTITDAIEKAQKSNHSAAETPDNLTTRRRNSRINQSLARQAQR